ncbi:MAG: 30S ribosomal protein S15 [Candidatus Gastranaerophilales bacterium]|nr:30S ribosomal protein S15 [Candidatus Gastranaerophilales bacterium]
MSLDATKKAEVIKKFGKSAKNTGSVEVQIALLTTNVTELTEHLKEHKKDFQGRRGLLMMVGKRKRLLAYLKKENLEKYRDLIKQLKIRG